ncbi:MAG: PhnE/PtxC family ABC transporter permease, partial [Gemmatimonadales bacterium]
MRRNLKRTGLILAILVVYGWFLAATEVSLIRLVRGLPWMADFVRRMIPPDLSVLASAATGALQTLQIAVVGTTLAAILALPLGFLSARNVVPASLFYPARALLNLLRSVDTMVYALFFVAAVGLG